MRRNKMIGLIFLSLFLLFSMTGVATLKVFGSDTNNGVGIRFREGSGTSGGGGSGGSGQSGQSGPQTSTTEPTSTDTTSTSSTTDTTTSQTKPGDSSGTGDTDTSGSLPNKDKDGGNKNGSGDKNKKKTGFLPQTGEEASGYLLMCGIVILLVVLMYLQRKARKYRS